MLFAKDLAKMSKEFFQEAMPVGKSWKKSRQSGRLHCMPCRIYTRVNKKQTNNGVISELCDA